MSFPYIIWAMRRTGGTTLATLLATLSEHPKVPHEPFNPERAFGKVTRDWHENRDPEQLRADLRAVLEPRPVIKHCYEIIAPEVNRALLEVSIELGYRHLILDRDAEADRILSLELAQATGAWGGKETRRILKEIEEGKRECAPIDIAGALRHLEYCQKRRVELDALMAELGQAPFTVFFEEVYGEPAAGRVRVRQVLGHLRIDPKAHPVYRKMLNDALLGKGQNSASVLECVPNIAEARAALEAAAENLAFRFEPSPLHPTVLAKVSGAASPQP